MTRISFEATAMVLPARMAANAGAKPAVVNRAGMAPLAMAARYGRVPSIDRLLKAGADAKALGPNWLVLMRRHGRS